MDAEMKARELPGDLAWKIEHLTPSSDGVVTLSANEWAFVKRALEQPASAAGDAERRRFIDRTGFCIVGDERGYWLWNEKTGETTDGYHSTPNAAIDSAIAAAPKQGDEK